MLYPQIYVENDHPSIIYKRLVKRILKYGKSMRDCIMQLSF